MEVSGMIKVLVRVAVRPVMMMTHAHKVTFANTSALKQSRIKPVLCPLPEFQHRRGLRDFINGQIPASRHDFLGPWSEAMLQCLGLHGPGNPQPHSTRDQPAQM